MSHQDGKSKKKFLGNNFAFSDAKNNISRPLSREGIADLPSLRTLLKSDRFCFISMSKFDSFKNPFTMVASLSEVYFGSKQENWFLWAIIPAQTDENYGEKLVLTWYFRWGYIHQFQPDHSYNSIGATEAPNLNISCMQGSYRSEKSKRNIIFNMAWETHGKWGNLKIFWQVVRENQGIKKK